MKIFEINVLRFVNDAHASAAIAAQTPHQLPVAVQFGQEFGVNAGLPMEVIRVLRNQELEFAELLERDQSQVRGVGPDLARGNTPSRRREAGVAPGPHPVGATEIRDAGVGADACAREGDQVLALNYPLSYCLNLLFQELSFVHDVCSL